MERFRKFVIAAAFVLLLAHAVQADMAEVSANMELTWTNGVTWTGSGHSRSLVYVVDSLSNSAVQDDFSVTIAPTFAEVDIGTVRASAVTKTWFDASAGAVAAPGPSTQSWTPNVYAGQTLEFQAVADGPITFTFDVDYLLSLQTDAPGDWDYAYGKISVYASLENRETDAPWRDAVQAEYAVYNGADYFYSATDVSLDVSGDFLSGEPGLLAFSVSVYAGADNRAAPPVVPAPAGVLLGFLGLGTAGVKLRRFV